MNSTPPGRLMTLDAFRGMTIAAMILVNDPGSWDHVYAQLLHAEWVGPTFTDLIFPFFLFIAGVAMWFSFKRRAPRDSPRVLWKKILLRASLIFLVGLFISWFPFFDIDQSMGHIRFTGVLQRIAVSYVIAAVICISVGRRAIVTLAVLLLLAYWALLTLDGGADPYSFETVYRHGIDFIAFRSSLSSAVPIMVGFLVGSYIDRPVYDRRVFVTLIGIGISMVVVGKVWSFELPMIKLVVWTSSYVVYTVGIGIIVFCLCLWIIEVAGKRSWAIPFVMFGLNPLFLYAVSIVLDKLTWVIKVGAGDTQIALHEWIYRSLFAPLGSINGSLLYAVCFVLLHWLIAYGMYRRHIFIKV